MDACAIEIRFFLNRSQSPRIVIWSKWNHKNPIKSQQMNVSQIIERDVFANECGFWKAIQYTNIMCLTWKRQLFVATIKTQHFIISFNIIANWILLFLSNWLYFFLPFPIKNILNFSWNLLTEMANLCSKIHQNNVGSKFSENSRTE